MSRDISSGMEEASNQPLHLLTARRDVPLTFGFRDMPIRGRLKLKSSRYLRYESVTKGPFQCDVFYQVLDFEKGSNHSEEPRRLHSELFYLLKM